MFFVDSPGLHPNIPKHVAEYVIEKMSKDKLFPKEVLEKLRNTNFYKQPNGMGALDRFLRAQEGLSSSLINTVLLEVNNYIYNSKDPIYIIVDYIYTSSVRHNIYVSLKRYNNNKNYTFDLEAILKHFAEFCSKSVITGYSLDSNGLGGYLTNTYECMYVKSNTDFITGILNDKGSVVETEEGSVMLEELIGIEDVKVQHTIDFPNVVKSIYDASQVLFDISNSVRYNLFSYFVSRDLDDLEEKLKSLLVKSFTNNYAPELVFYKKGLGDTSYRVKTINFRLELLSFIIKSSEGGITSDSLRRLYNTVLEMDAGNNNSDVGKLFIHTETIGNSSSSNKKSNESKFLQILKGINATKELQVYLETTKQKLYEGDCELLFESPYYYRRFSSIEDYFILRDVTPKLVEDSKHFNISSDEVVYETNDDLFEILLRTYDLNFSSLKEYLKSDLNSQSKDDIDTTLKTLAAVRAKLEVFYNSACASYNKIKENIPGLDMSSPDVYDGIAKATPEAEFVLNKLIFKCSPIEKADFLELKDIRIALRFANFFIVLIDHFGYMLSKSSLTLDEAMLSIDFKDVYLPESLDILNMEDIVKFKNSIPINFFLSEGESPKDISLRKQYSIFYLEFTNLFAGLMSYLKKWVSELETEAESISLMLNTLRVSPKLKLISLQIMKMKNNSFSGLDVFASRRKVVDGYVFVNEKPYKHPKGYIHIRGYFVNPDLNYSITEIHKGETL